jgi:hypothetical protein
MRTVPVNEGYTIITGTGEGTNKAYLDVWLEYGVTQDIQANTSTIHLLLYAQCTKSSTTSYPNTLEFGGVWVDGEKPVMLETDYDFQNYRVNKFGDHTFVVAHGQDGKRNVTLNGKFVTKSTYLAGGSASGVVELPQIPRAAEIGTISNAVCGQDVTVGWVPKLSGHSFKVRLTVDQWNDEVTTGPVEGAQTKSIDIPMDVAAQIPNATGIMTVTLETYSGDNKLGEDSKEVTITVPQVAETLPEVNLELSFGNMFNGLLLQGVSTLTATITDTGKYGATTTAKLYVDTEAMDSTENVLLTGYGDVTVSAIVTDSRGFSATTSQDINVTAYSAPKVVNVSAYRCYEDGAKSVDGEYLRISATRSYSKITGNGCDIWYQVNDGDEVIIHEKGTASDTVETSALMGGSLDNTETFNITVGCTDTVGKSGSTVIVIPRMEVHNHKASNGWGFGGMCDFPGMDVHWDAKFRGKVYIGDLTLEEYIKSLIGG